MNDKGQTPRPPNDAAEGQAGTQSCSGVRVPPRAALEHEEVPEQEVMVALLRAHESMHCRLARFFQRWRISVQQFNVLRILYVQAHEYGVSCSTVKDRLIHRGADMTRMLDRLETLGWVERVRCGQDRRVVRARLTRSGYELVEDIWKPLIAEHKSALSSFAKDEIEQLRALLGRLAALEEPCHDS